MTLGMSSAIFDSRDDLSNQGRVPSSEKIGAVGARDHVTLILPPPRETAATIGSKET